MYKYSEFSSTHNVFLSSGSGNSVAGENKQRIMKNHFGWKSFAQLHSPSLKFSYEIFSLGLWFQANTTAVWKVVTSRSNFPTELENVIYRTEKIPFNHEFQTNSSNNSRSSPSRLPCDDTIVIYVHYAFSDKILQNKNIS